MGARAAYERALRILEKIPVEEHPNLTSVINNLGDVLRAQGDLEGAQAALERAMQIDEVAHGPVHPKLGIRINNLGLVLHAQGDLAGAKAHYGRALRMVGQFLPAGQPNIERVRGNLAAVEEEIKK